MPQLCQPCKERGREQLAHRIVQGTSMCNFCFRGELHPTERVLLREQKKLMDGRTRLEMEAVMPKQFQNVQALEADQKSGMSIGAIAKKHGISYSTAFKYLGGRKKGKRPDRRAADSNDGIPSLKATPELVNAIWNSLELSKQVGLLNKLAEI